ncbi:MAG: MotE family protein [Ignavibacteriaceae bacterium]
MKSKIIYSVAFLAAFLLTTAGIIYFNSIYKDIFALDFSRVPFKAGKISISDTSKVSFSELRFFFQNEFKRELFDSLRVFYTQSKNDTANVRQAADSALIDSLNSLKLVIQQKNENENQQILAKLSEQQKKNAKVKVDSSYILWTKQTAKLYESMDPQQAAKIIQSYSDNVARDIIYSMRQKKAAEVLSALNPGTANRITLAK